MDNKLFRRRIVLTFKCTQKVRDYLSLAPDELTDHEVNSESLLGDWYVNLIVIDRRKCLLFMNERTLLSFIAIGFKKSKGLKHDVYEMFIDHLFNLYKLLEFPLDGLNQVMDDYVEYRYSKTASKKLLGNMNDLAHLYQATIAYNDGIAECNIAEIIRLMNYTPQATLNHQYPVDMAKALLLSQLGTN